MSKPMVHENGVSREMTDAEYAQYLDDVAAAEHQHTQAAAQQAAKESARAKLAALGLTNDEINALIP